MSVDTTLAHGAITSLVQARDAVATMDTMAMEHVMYLIQDAMSHLEDWLAEQRPPEPKADLDE